MERVCGTVLTPALSIPQPEPQARIITLSVPIFPYTADMHMCSQCGAVVSQQINNWSGCACVFVCEFGRYNESVACPPVL